MRNKCFNFVCLLVLLLVSACQGNQVDVAAETSLSDLISAGAADTTLTNNATLCAKEEDTAILIKSLALNPVHNLLAVTTQCSTVLMDATTLQTTHDLGTMLHQVSAWSADGDWLAGVDAAGKIGIYGIESQQIVRQLDFDGGEVFRIAFSPDGQWIAVLSASKLLIWNAQNGAIKLALEGGRSMSWSPDSQQLAVAVYSSENAISKIRIENLDAKKGGKYISINTFGNDVAWSPDGKTIAVAIAGYLVGLFDADLNLLRELEGFTMNIEALAWSADSHHLIALGSNDIATLWDLQNLDDGFIEIAASSSPLQRSCVVYAPASDQIYYSRNREVKQISVQNFVRLSYQQQAALPTQQEAGSVATPEAGVGLKITSEAISHDKVSAGNIQLVNINASPTGAGGVYTLAEWAPDGTHYAVYAANSQIEIWEAFSNTLVKTIPVKLELSDFVFNMIWASPKYIGLHMNSSVIRAFDVDSGEEVLTMNEPGLRTFLWLRDMNSFLCVSNNILWRYDMDTDRRINWFYITDGIPYADRLVTIALNKNSLYLGNGGMMNVYDNASASIVDQVITDDQDVVDLTVSPDGAEIAIITADSSIRIYNIKDKAITLSTTGNGERPRINSLQWIASGQFIFFNTDDGLRFWAVSEESDIKSLNIPLTYYTISAGGQYLLAVDENAKYLFRIEYIY